MISLFEMEPGCFELFRENFIREYAGSISSNYGYSERKSFEFASLDFEMRLPNKLDTDGNYVCSIKLGGTIYRSSLVHRECRRLNRFYL